MNAKLLWEGAVRWRKPLLALAAVALVLYSCSGGALFPHRYRFRMTVEVETPQGLKTGSSVMEVTAYKSWVLTAHESPGGGGLRGEAVIVDLPGGPLFTLLRICDGCENLDVPITEALLPGREIKGVDGYVSAVGRLGWFFSHARAELPRKNWPLMVRFRDIGDPKSIEQVDPASAGVKRIVVETTDDLITVGLVTRLKWLTGRYSFFDTERDPKTGHALPAKTVTVAHILHGYDFSSEIRR